MYSNFSSFYDSLTKNVDYKKRANYFKKIITKYKKDLNEKILLDVGCGTGSLSLEFNEIGFDVIGVDVSSDMLNVAMTKSAGKNILYLNQDIVELDLYGTVDIAVSALDTFNHLKNIEKVKEAFFNINLFLHPDGIFILDVNTKYKHKNVLGNNVFTYENDEVYTVWKNHLNDDFSVTIELDFFENIGNNQYVKTSECFDEIYISYDDIKNIVNELSMKIVAVYGDDSFNEPTNNTERLIYVIKKGE